MVRQRQRPPARIRCPNHAYNEVIGMLPATRLAGNLKCDESAFKCGPRPEWHDELTMAATVSDMQASE